MAEETSTTALVETPPPDLQLSLAAIETTKHNIALCEKLVKEVLEPDIDFGIIPGVPTPFLWDSGAAKIMAAFNCYADYQILHQEETASRITYTFQTRLICRATHAIVATGIGACSTNETKYKYRWIDDPQAEGIPITGLKRRRDGKYRVPNPEAEELLNTVAKMAAKRADVDAVTSLPGVSGTLRKLFKPTRALPEKTPWSLFYAKLNTLGVSPGRAHSILNVPSIKDDWVEKQHRTLDEAYDIIKAATVSPLKGEEPVHDAKT